MILWTKAKKQNFIFINFVAQTDKKCSYVDNDSYSCDFGDTVCQW